jgi:hypothetical protein
METAMVEAKVKATATAQATLMESAMGKVKAKARVRAMAKAKVILMAMATGMVKARWRVKARATATDRQRVAQFAAQGDSVSSA